MDLNLLVAFEALWAERSVTRAGRRLSLSQSAMSGALARLRTMLGDPVFVRGAKGLEPTDRCLELAAPIANALLELRAALFSGRFDPATSDRTFSIGAVDAAIAVVVPRLFRRVLAEAPRARFVVTPIDPARAIALVGEGRLDLAIAPVSRLEAGVGARALYRVELALVMRKGHPLAGRRLTLADLEHYPQALVSFIGAAHSPTDDVLRRAGKRRHVAIVLSSFLAVPHVIRETDVLSYLPLPFAKKLEAEGQVTLAPLPDGFPAPRLSMRALWPLAQDASPASRWLRQAVFAVARSLEVSDGD